MLQKVVMALRRFFPRGWAPALSGAAHVFSTLRRTRAELTNGDSLVVDLRERMCMGLFLNGGQPHERGTEKLFRRALRPGDVVVDVGANVGFYTRVLSRLVGSEGRVLAFEPMPAALDLLRAHPADLQNTRVFGSAVGMERGRQQFFVRRSGDTSSLLPGEHVSTIDVESVLLDDVANDLPRLDLIKIDVEGWEREVLEGARQTLTRHRPIVYFEYLDEVARRRAISVDTFRTFFEPLDYVLRWIDHSEVEERLFSDVATNYLVAVPRGRITALE